MGYKADVLSRNPVAYHRMGEASGLVSYNEVGPNGLLSIGTLPPLPPGVFYGISPPPVIDDGNTAIGLDAGRMDFHNSAPIWGLSTVLFEVWARQFVPGIMGVLYFMGGPFGMNYLWVNAGVMSVKWGVETFSYPMPCSIVPWRKYSVLINDSILSCWADNILVFSRVVAHPRFADAPGSIIMLVGGYFDEGAFYTSIAPSGWIFEDGEWKRPPVNYLISANPSSGIAPLRTKFSVGVV